MKNSKPQRLLTIEQISNRWFWSKVQSFVLGTVIFFSFGGVAYIALVRG